MNIFEIRQKIQNMSDEERANNKIEVCPRCCGTGKYSYCTLYGDWCFKCNGIGYIKMPTKKTKKEEKKNENITIKCN